MLKSPAGVVGRKPRKVSHQGPLETSSPDADSDGDDACCSSASLPDIFEISYIYRCRGKFVPPFVQSAIKVAVVQIENPSDRGISSNSYRPGSRTRGQCLVGCQE